MERKITASAIARRRGAAAQTDEARRLAREADDLERTIRVSSEALRGLREQRDRMLDDASRVGIAPSPLARETLLNPAGFAAAFTVALRDALSDLRVGVGEGRAPGGESLRILAWEIDEQCSGFSTVFAMRGLRVQTFAGRSKEPYGSVPSPVFVERRDVRMDVGGVGALGVVFAYPSVANVVRGLPLKGGGGGMWDRVGRLAVDDVTWLAARDVAMAVSSASWSLVWPARGRNVVFNEMVREIKVVLGRV